MEQEKILILNLSDELSQEIEEVLNLDVLEVVQSIEDLENREPRFIIKPVELELEDNILFKQSRIISFERISEVRSFLKEKGDVIFNPEFVGTDIGRILLERFFTRSAVVQMEVAYEKILLKSFSTKFSNPLTVGYYTDIVTKFAHSEKADITGLRTFLSAATSFFTFLAKKDLGWFPLDVDYGVSNDALVIQITAPVSKMYKDYILQAITEEDSSNPFVGLIDICSKQSHALDLCYLEKSNKVIFTGIWLKNTISVGKSFFPTMLLSELYTYEEQRESRKNNITSKIMLTREEGEVNFEDIPGSVVETFEEKASHETGNLPNIKKLVKFIRKYRENEDGAIPDVDLNLRDIAKYLRKYPDQSIISQIEQEDRETILKCFKNESMELEIEETINTVKDSLDKEEYLQTVLDNLTELEIDDVVKISSSLEEDERSSKVNGLKENKEVLKKVSGSNEKEEEHKIVISSTESEKEPNLIVKSLDSSVEEKGVLKFKNLEAQNSSLEKSSKNLVVQEENVLDLRKEKIAQEEIELGNIREEMRARNKRKHDQEELILSGEWEEKKRKIAEKLNKNLEKIKNGEEVSSIKTLEEELEEVFKDELGSDELGESLAKGITESSSERLVSEKLESVQKAKEKIEKEKVAQTLAMRDEQILRMKKVLDTIKNENKTLKTKLYEESSSEGDDSSGLTNAEDSKEFKILKGSVDSLKKEVSIRDIAYEKLKESQAIALENKGKQVEQLENRLNSVLDSQNKNGENDLAVKMKKVSNENRLLHSQIEVKDRTIENMSRRIEMGKQDINHKDSVELKRVKEQNIVALDAMRAFKTEKSNLESKLRVAERELKLKEAESTILRSKEISPAVDQAAQLRNKDNEIKAAKIENGKLADQVKSISIRCKQLEQKMKFLNAQVESANKSRGGMKSKSGNASSGREAKLALKLKQLETSREKLSMDAQKMSAQLDSKKKEAVSLTTENNLLKNKMAELEQKLNKFERKAS